MAETLEIFPLTISTKEPEMDLEQNYDVVEEKSKAKIQPRAIAVGDVLKHIEDRDHYLAGAPTCHEMNLTNTATGVRWTDRVPVCHMAALTRAEASSLCADQLHAFCLVGRANDVLTVNDPGE